MEPSNVTNIVNEMPRKVMPAKLFAALAKAQGKFPEIEKDQEAVVQGKEGRQGYSYAYASLAAILNAVRPVLSENELTIFDRIYDENGKTYIEVFLAHGSGETITSRMMLNTAQPPQALGSQITYFRRYMSTSLLGIAASEDDDGQQAQQNHQSNGNGQRRQNNQPPANRQAQPQQQPQAAHPAPQPVAAPAQQPGGKTRRELLELIAKEATNCRDIGLDPLSLLVQKFGTDRTSQMNDQTLWTATNFLLDCHRAEAERKISMLPKGPAQPAQALKPGDFGYQGPYSDPVEEPVRQIEEEDVR